MSYSVMRRDGDREIRESNWSSVENFEIGGRATFAVGLQYSILPESGMGQLFFLAICVSHAIEESLKS